MIDQDKQAILTKWENHQEDNRIEAEEVARWAIEAVEQRQRAEMAMAELQRIKESVSNSLTVTEKIVIDRMDNHFSVSSGMVAALLQIIGNERAARIQADTALARGPVLEIRRAMADTTAQHYSWYAPISLWLESANG